MTEKKLQSYYVNNMVPILVSLISVATILSILFYFAVCYLICMQNAMN